VITILPGAQDHTRPRFLDITVYPIEKGQELTWFNDDDISHRIIINLVTQNNSTELVADSEIINPDNSFTYTFEEEGTCHFSSPNYPWIKGIVFVSDDDISTTTQTDSKNDIVQPTILDSIFTKNRTGDPFQDCIYQQRNRRKSKAYRL
jgi:hypothetical protein